MNKNTIPFKSTLLKNKLASVLQTLLKARDTAPSQTKEALIAEAVKLVTSFYRQLDSSGFVPVKVFPGGRPDPDLFNEQFGDIKSDLDILYAELENIEGIVLEQFNITATNTTRLNGHLKRIASKVSDYSLYARLPTKDTLFFTDTFSDFSRVDNNSALLNSTQCEINQAEGIVTLPVVLDQSATIKLTERPVINSNSNGRAGNNEDVTANQINNNLEAVLDNNADTWFEYERVELVDTNVPLVLDITMNLTDPQIINFIRINPNNFGTKTQVKILNIDTSADGQIFTSIKDDIPISGYLTQDEANVFSLAASTSKFAGQGLFTFTPSTVKYIRLTFEQAAPYMIQTVRGKQFRYAIGLRDIEIKRLAYEAKGELISSPFTTVDEVAKVSLETTQSPLQESELASIKHQLSFDDGISWHNIRPRSSQGSTNSVNPDLEILTLNVSVPGAIQTDTPVNSIRYRAVLERKADGFTSGSTAFAESIVGTIETHGAPSGSPWTITLINSPVIDSVQLIDPNFGSRGKTNNRYLLGSGTTSARSFSLPWVLPFDSAKEFVGGSWVVTNKPSFTLYVGGEAWSLRPSLSDSGPEDKHFTYTLGNNTTGLRHVRHVEVFVQLGNGTNGMAPPQGAPIEVALTPERLLATAAGRHAGKLRYPTGADKSTVRVVRRGETLPSSQQLEKDSQIQRLPVGSVIVDAEHPISFVSSGIFNSSKRRTFRNGLLTPEGELDEAGAWSIDEATGTIYSYSRTDPLNPGSVSYFYRADVELTTAQWDFVNADELNEELEIKEEAWVTKTRPSFAVPSGIQKIGLPDLAAVKGTLKFEVPSNIKGTTADPFIEEVEFSGDPSTPELVNVVKTEEVIPVLDPGVGNVAVFTLQAPIATSTSLAVSFSDNSIFVTEKANEGALVDLGDWSVERAAGGNYGKVYVRTNGASFSSPGTVTYYIVNAAQVKGGAYSVDYSKGIIYTQRPVPSADFKVTYDYSDYVIYYNIARKVSEADWTLDAASKTITLKDKEIKARSQFSQSANSNALSQAVYQVSYKHIATVRQNIADLTNYFSPVLKDYALQIITKENL